MSSNWTETLIQRYLDRVAAQLQGLPAEEREEILGDLRAHVYEAIGDPHTASEAHVRNVLDRLGDPVDLAREARGRPAGASGGHPPVYRRVTKSPGLLEIAAIVLTALAWPIGVILAWVSPRWLTRDKVIATAIPLFGFILFLTLPFVFGWTGVTPTAGLLTELRPMMPVPAPGGMFPGPFGPSLIDEARQLFMPFGHVLALPLFLIGSIGTSFISALYLSIRLQPVEERFYPDDTRITNGVPAGGAV